MAKEPPTFDPTAIPWAHTVLFQSLIVQLIDANVLSVENAQRVFDIALQRATKERERVPDAERLIQHIHDNMRWDEYYRIAAQKMANKNPSDGQP